MAAWTDWMKENQDWLVPAATAATGAYGAYSQSKSSREDRELRREESEADRLLRERQVALEESGMDPFRHQRDQAGALAYLDMLARAQFDPVQISVPGVQAPQISGGMSYTPNPDLRESARMLQRDVATGRGAPTMTDPANYGRTGAMNLLQPGGTAGGGAAMPRGDIMPGISRTAEHARAAGMRSQPETQTSGYLQSDDPFLASALQTDRRGGEDSASGRKKTVAMAGAAAAPFTMGLSALAGPIAGMFGGAAESAPSDFRLADAQRIIGDAIRTYAGRDPKPGEVDQYIAGQGWEHGDRWVGEEGLMGVLDLIARNADYYDQQQPPSRTETRTRQLFG